MSAWKQGRGKGGKRRGERGVRDEIQYPRICSQEHTPI
jgi:hypothetical protein